MPAKTAICSPTSEEGFPLPGLRALRLGWHPLHSQSFARRPRPGAAGQQLLWRRLSRKLSRAEKSLRTRSTSTCIAFCAPFLLPACSTIRWSSKFPTSRAVRDWRRKSRRKASSCSRTSASLPLRGRMSHSRRIHWRTCRCGRAHRRRFSPGRCTGRLVVPPRPQAARPMATVSQVWMPSSPLRALAAKLPSAKISYVSGDDLAAAAAAARSADVAIVFAYQPEVGRHGSEVARSQRRSEQADRSGCRRQSENHCRA